MTDARALLDRILDAPPVVHTMGRPDVLGVWSTDRACYEHLLASVRPGDATLETGAGLSTLLLAAAGCVHTVVTPIAAEESRLREAAEQLEVDLSRTTFVIASSDDALPGLVPDPLDLVLVDGGHGFPAPILDWYYAGRRLREGGLLVVDDAFLPAVGTLLSFLEADPSWVPVASSPKWASFRRTGSGSILAEHNRQPWYESGRPSDLGSRRLAALLSRAAVRSARRRLGR